MKRRLLTLIALLASAWPGAEADAAAGVDQSFIRTESEKTWGERLAASVGYGQFSKSYALVIGISDYAGGYNDLPTGNDARRMADYLFDEAGFDHVHLLTEDRVTNARVAELMSEEFPRLLDENDRFLFYWSGHGDTRGVAVGGGKAGYLPLWDTEPERWSRMIAMEDVQRWNRFLPARQSLFLLDACFGGLAGVVPQSSSTRNLRVEQLAQPGHHVLSAGTENEQTIASDYWGGSLFTRALIDGLRGDADAATGFERDGIVSLTELKSYVQHRVLQERQLAGWTDQITPQLRDLRVNQGEFFFLTKEVPGGDQELVIDGNIDVDDKGGAAGDSQRAPDDGPTDATLAQVPVVSDDPVKLISGPSREPLSTFRECEKCPEMVVIPAGAFFMGSRSSEAHSLDNERPRHRVSIGSFAIGKYEVTFDEWDACVAADGCQYDPYDGDWGRGVRPVIDVSWDDIQQYVAWLSRMTGETYRLPSEAEWEYAARAHPTSKGPNAPPYAYGGTITKDQANFGDHLGQTIEVGSFPANAWGLHDMHGNVFEWVEDHYHGSYDGAPFDGRPWIDKSGEASRVLRGGSLLDKREALRSAQRFSLSPDNSLPFLGFRVARTITP